MTSVKCPRSQCEHNNKQICSCEEIQFNFNSQAICKQYKMSEMLIRQTLSRWRSDKYLKELIN